MPSLYKKICIAKDCSTGKAYGGKASGVALKALRPVMPSTVSETDLTQSIALPLRGP